MPEEEEEIATATAQAAREAAEARRRKILDSMNDRMSIVEGTAGTKGKDDGGDEDAVPADDAPSSSTTPSASSRMAAMRRRRFKNKNKKEEAAAGAAPAEDAAAKNKAEAVSSSVAKTEKAKDSDEEKEDTAPVSEAPKVVEKSKVEETPAATTTETKTPDSSTAEPKKKYQGVAKMRRRMIKEKQQQKELEKPDSTTSGTAAPAIDTKKVVARIQKRPAVLPILMHVVTVLLLFLAGLDVGLQQQQIDYFDGALLTVHSELAPRRQLGGLALVQKWTMGSADEEASKPSGKKPVGVDDEWQATTTTLEHDEFADVGRDSCESESSNLDPLFQVDLDKLTEGPGLYMWLARGAIRLHRLNLAIFWYGPRGFFLGLADWLFSLTTSPPVLCVLAIIIRQLVGKVVLGAKLPSKVEDETQHKDVMSMIKLFISNFLFKSFPTATHLYDVWTHVRADMYVLLCGVFVGMAYSHNAAAGSPFGGKGSTSLGRFEEFVPPPALEPELPPTTSTEGISDEL